MKDTHWLESPRMIEVSYNETTDALFMLSDIREALSDKVKRQPLGELDFTIDNALDQLMQFVEDLDNKCTKVAP